MARAFVACLTVAVLTGWLLDTVGLGFGFFALWGAIFYGGLVAEVGLRATGRKRGREMEIIVGVCAGAGLLIPRAAEMLFIAHPYRFLMLGLNIYFLAMVVIGVGAAVSRIRYM